MASVAATLVESEEPGSVVIAAAGHWLVTAAAELDRRLRAIRVPRDKRVTLDLSGVDRLDTAGAWLLLRTEHELAARGNQVALSNLPGRFAPLFEQVRARGVSEPLPHPVPAHHSLVGFVERVGHVTVELLNR